MLAEIISIGDEITSGQRLDTNSQWLSARLAELGVRAMYHTTVSDDLSANVAVFRAATERADIVVATGGLGPTADDLTREALAQTVGQPLELRADALSYIESLFARRQRPMPESNRLQAMFPRGSRMIANPRGTAPGIDMDVSRSSGGASRVFALPGVPTEMFEMWNGTVAPAIAKLLPRPRQIVYRRIKCFGVGESDLEQMLPDLVRRGREPQVGITVSGATITLRIAAEGETAAECLEKMQPTIDTIHQCLGTLVFGEEDDELQDTVVRMLRQQRRTLAVADCGPGGLLAGWLTAAQREAVPVAPIKDASAHLAAAQRIPEPGGNIKVPGPGEFQPILGGFSVPTELARRRLLALGGQSANGQTAPQSTGEQEVTALALAVRAALAADYGLAIGDLPYYDPKAPGPPPEFHYSIAKPDGVSAKASPYAGPEDVISVRAVKQALNLLRLELMRAE